MGRPVASEDNKQLGIAFAKAVRSVRRVGDDGGGGDGGGDARARKCTRCGMRAPYLSRSQARHAPICPHRRRGMRAAYPLRLDNGGVVRRSA